MGLLCALVVHLVENLQGKLQTHEFSTLTVLPFYSVPQGPLYDALEATTNAARAGLRLKVGVAGQPSSGEFKTRFSLHPHQGCLP
ncbi:unnamed protein product [Protopolystoma xenopodis]|uniref:Uncharacterized protein n=1 Tax=Protopolystoma xenopodis TaxID=117903 RepID=A0A448XBK3_9PLAT|nr:unnamed protein product [Protopolystoma xenopodis]